MVERIKEAIQNHKKAILIGGVAAGGLALAYYGMLL
jgi:hypothetical protein